MDCSPTKRRETVIDIESCIKTSQEVETPSLSDDTIENIVSVTICGVPMSADEIVKGENSSSLSNNSKNIDNLSPDKAKNNNSKREKHKSITAKKPSKPPRPPKGLSLDVADQKLIKEISELAMIKRARIERMKALKKMNAAKASSLSTSSSGNLIAMVFTIIFFIVIIFQGCHSSGISPANKLAIHIEGSLESKGVAVGNIIAVQDQRNFSTSGVPLASVESPNLVKLVPGSDSTDEAKKPIH